MRILVLNSGSSSLKFGILECSAPDSPPDPIVKEICRGAVTGIGRKASLTLKRCSGPAIHDTQAHISDHRHAVQWMWNILDREWQNQPPEAPDSTGGIDAVGVRVVHGGQQFTQPVLLDSQVLQAIEDLTPLAPLHHPLCLEGIHAIRSLLGSQVPVVAVFDTAFHHALPPQAFTYAIPHSWSTQYGIRRFGFHGIAHASLAHLYAGFRRRTLDELRLITFQLGQGCSVTALNCGAVVETSMGFTPLEGLVMGTRSGDLDPAILPFLAKHANLSLDELHDQLQTQAGLLGISGQSSDMRELLQAAEAFPDSPAALAIDVFAHRAKKYLGAYLAVLGGADAVIFGGGIGEHAPVIRARICAGMEWCGLRLDAQANSHVQRLEPGTLSPIHNRSSSAEILVGGSDEEGWIAHETYHLLTTP